jgi:hypothetical protein
MLAILVMASVSGFEVRTEKTTIVKDGKVLSLFAADFSKENTCHPADAFVEGPSVQSRTFELTADSLSEVSVYAALQSSTGRHLDVNLNPKGNFQVSTAPTNITLDYKCENTGWTIVSLKFMLDSGKNYEIKWQKFCGDYDGNDWSLAILTVVAVGIVWLAAYSARNISSIQTIMHEDENVLTESHAFGFVIVGSVFLVLLFYFMSYLVYVLEVLFAVMAAGAILSIAEDLGLQSYWPRSYILPVFGQTSAVSIISALTAITVVLWYMFTRNWLLNNILGLCFAYTIIRSVKIPSLKVGGLLLGLAFFYDIFWVFFSSYLFQENVMVSVASGLDLPIKLECPHLSSVARPYSCSMLGLGDLALPGLFMAFASRFDHIYQTKYLNVMVICYAAALICCDLVLVVFQHAQPALLYISPMLIFGMLGYAYSRGEVEQVFKGLRPHSSQLEPYEMAMSDIRRN